MAQLSSSTRQRNRLMQRAAELERMSVAQFEREGRSEAVPTSDPTEPSHALDRLIRNMDDEARAAGAQQDDSFASFNDWDNKLGADDQITADVQDQRDDALDLGEDVPRVPAPGRRIDEDQLSRSDTADEPRGRSKLFTDPMRPGLRRGKRYSAAESIREAFRGAGVDPTAELLQDQEAHYFATHSTPRGNE